MLVSIMSGWRVCYSWVFFFFNDTATTEIYTLSLHDALPICKLAYTSVSTVLRILEQKGVVQSRKVGRGHVYSALLPRRSEEHTSELQSRQYLVCRLLLEKKKKTTSQAFEHDRCSSHSSACLN